MTDCSRRFHGWLLALVCCWAFLLAVFPSYAADSRHDMAAQVRMAVERQQEWYSPQTGLWRTTGWWNAANLLTTLVDYSRVSHFNQYRSLIPQTYAANKDKGFLNEFYDDEGWWALAWIDAYDLTGEPAYLKTAQAIFQDMTGGWDNVCGGGVYWKKNRRYKNAIPNELFLSVAAHLANRVQDPAQKADYSAWADREWAWFRQTGMIGPDHLINDGLDAQCKNNHQTEWTYNQGVVLGGLSELSRIPGHKNTLPEAESIADAAIARMADAHGILHDPCEPGCGADGTQFKGIFIRNLSLFNRRAPHRRYAEFIHANAASILDTDQNSDYSFGVVWSGPPTAANASAQGSALDALVAALALQHERGSKREPLPQ
jgi:predicted alpha-1,6-mannanase (GH76 family)